MFSVWMTFAICLVQHTHKSPLSAKAPLCFGLATPKHRQRKIDAWPDSLSLSLCSTLLRLDSWAFSSQLLMVETKTRMNIDRGSWLQVQSAALKVNEKTKANENLQKRKWKWIPKVCNNFAIIIYSMKMRRRASN